MLWIIIIRFNLELLLHDISNMNLEIRIRNDYKNGRSIRNLALKYSCPRSQIAKAIKDLKELKIERQKKRQSDVYDKVEHDYVFKKGHMAPEFQAEFGDQIRIDYQQKRSVRNLSLKYNCPRSQIKKAIKDGQNVVHRLPI